MAESFVKKIKRDYVALMPKPDRETALRNLAIAVEHYNEQHPHSALNYRHRGSSGAWQWHPFNGELVSGFEGASPAFYEHPADSDGIYKPGDHSIPTATAPAGRRYLIPYFIWRRVFRSGSSPIVYARGSDIGMPALLDLRDSWDAQPCRTTHRVLCLDPFPVFTDRLVNFRLWH